MSTMLSLTLSSLRTVFILKNHYRIVKITSTISSFNSIRLFHVSSWCNASQFKARDRKELLKTVTKQDEGTEGENLISVSSSIKTKEDMFTDENTPNMIFNGVPFKMVPICSVRSTKNNTLIYLGDWENNLIVSRTCGAEGFKNCRKGTNVAAQSTALYVSTKATAMGITDIRLKLNGLGPGRMAAIKGLEMGGLNIISITDDTRVPWKVKARPRKARRL